MGFATMTDTDGLAPSADSLGRLPRGATLGRYVVLDYVGHGGMGVVYSAYDFGLDRKVSLKIVRDAAGSDASGERQQRLVREAQALARVSHPNVVTVHDVGTFEDQVYIAMELVEGPSLDAFLQAAPRTWKEVLPHFLEAGRGLAMAHRAGLVHRDFKPENVLLGVDGRVRVTDFGLARSASEVGTEQDVQGFRPLRNRAAGTPGYMAPEQERGAALDGRADQFSFCVSLHEALYGQRPGPLRPLALAPRGRGGLLIPFRIRSAVARGLSLKAGERFPTLEALLSALEDRPRGWVERSSLPASLAVCACAWLLASSSRGPAPRGDAPTLLESEAEPNRGMPNADGPHVLTQAFPSPASAGRPESRGREFAGRVTPASATFTTGLAPPAPSTSSPSLALTRDAPGPPRESGPAPTSFWSGVASAVAEHLPPAVQKFAQRFLGAPSAVVSSGTGQGGGSAQLATLGNALSRARYSAGASAPSVGPSPPPSLAAKLERALDDALRSNASVEQLASARFALAKALWENGGIPDRDRALSLAQVAYSDISSASNRPSNDDLETSIRDWVEERKHRPERPRNFWSNDGQN